jgi:hypothetical protein
LLTAFTLAPLQGFLNFLLYFRPRIQKALKERRQARQQVLQRRQQNLNDASASISVNAYGSSPGMEADNIATIPELKTIPELRETEDHGSELDRSCVRSGVAAMVDSSSSYVN